MEFACRIPSLFPFSFKGRREKTDRIIFSFRRVRLAVGESRLVRPGTRSRAHVYRRRMAGHTRISRLPATFQTLHITDTTLRRRRLTERVDAALHLRRWPEKTVHSYDRLAIDLDVGTVRFSGLKAEDVTVATVVGSKTTDGVLEVTAERSQETKGVIEVTRYRLRLGASAFEVLKTAGPKGTEGEFRNQYLFKR